MPSASLADREDHTGRLRNDGPAALAVAVDIRGQHLRVEGRHMTVEEGDVGERVIAVGAAAMSAGDANHPVDFSGDGRGGGGSDAVGVVAGAVHDPVDAG